MAEIHAGAVARALQQPSALVFDVVLDVVSEMTKFIYFVLLYYNCLCDKFRV